MKKTAYLCAIRFTALVLLVAMLGGCFMACDKTNEVQLTTAETTEETPESTTPPQGDDNKSGGNNKKPTTVSDPVEEDPTILKNWSGKYKIDEDGEIIVSNNNSNNYVVSQTRAKAYTLEADVTFLNGTTGGFLFAAATSSSGSLGKEWNGLQIRENDVRLFCQATYNIDGGLNKVEKKSTHGIAANNSYHLKLDVTADGMMTVYVDGVKVMEAVQETYSGGYIGLLSFQSEIKYENIIFKNNDPKGFSTNLEGWRAGGGTWVDSTYGYGYRGKNSRIGAAFYVSAKQVSNEDFVIEGDIVFNKSGICNLVFGVLDVTKPAKNYYAVGIDKKSADKTIRLYKVVDGVQEWTVGNNLTEDQAGKNRYSVRLEVFEDGTMSCYLDNVLAFQYNEAADETSYNGGYIGIMTNSADVTFNNVYCQEKPINTDYRLTDLKLEGASFVEPFDVEDKDLYIQAVADDGVSKVTVIPSVDEYTKLFVGGVAVESGARIQVDLPTTAYGGYKLITVKTCSDDGYFAKSFTLCILRSVDTEILYSSPNRPQFHYTAPYGYLNDPNGMVYDAATGEYHLFYQSLPYPSAKHWGHVVTYDLVRFTEKNTALYPDNHGAMFSGSAIIDYDNVAGLYDESTPPESRIVLFWFGSPDSGVRTAGLAYTADGGDTWIKAHDGRTVTFIGGEPGAIDPKVLWLEEYEVYLMATASGKLYTSTDLWNWTYNSTDTSWECPELYEIAIEGTNETKWVKLYGGSFYRVGEIVKDSDGIFKFVPDENTGSLMYNGDSFFRHETEIDSGSYPAGYGVLYATQHYYDAANGRIISVSWLRENVHRLDPTLTWQGVMTIATEQTLYKKADGSYILYSYPVEEVKTLRGEALYSANDVTVTPDSTNILEGINATYADIEGEFTLDANVTEFGFKLRKGNDGGYITIKYDVANQLLIADYSNSKDDYYKEVRTMKMELSADRTVSLRILIDSIVVESFGNDGEASISSVFTRPVGCEGMEFFAVGGSVTINSLNVYAMDSAWISE